MDSNRALLEAATLFSSTRSMPALLRLVLERMVQMLGAERALFGVFDYQGEIEAAETHGFTWAGRGTPLPISNKSIAQVRQSQEICTIADASADVSLNQRESIRLHSLRFVLAMPVRACGRVAGVLYADSRAPQPREAERQTEVLRALAAFVGIALENVILYQEQRLRAALLDQLVHDLRTPLQVVTASATWLTDEGALDIDAVLDTAHDIALSAAKMNRMIEVSRRLSLAEAGVTREAPAPVDLGMTLRTQARVQGVVAREYQVAFAVSVPDDLPRVTTWADRVDLVLDNLVFNAMKHAPNGTMISLSAVRRRDAGPRAALERPLGDEAVLFQRLPSLVPDTAQGFVEVSVHNEGPPIPAAVLPDIFSPWVTGDDAARRGQRGSGLGLSIVHQCVGSLGGAVWVDSAADRGTRFSFTLPIVPKATVMRAGSRFPSSSTLTAV